MISSSGHSGPKQRNLGYECQQCQQRFDEVQLQNIFQSDGSMLCTQCGGPVFEVKLGAAMQAAQTVSKLELNSALDPIIKLVDRIEETKLLAPLTAHTQRTQDKREQYQQAEKGINRAGV